MPKMVKQIRVRIMDFRDAWSELAPDATFAGMNLTEFVEASEPPFRLREEIGRLQRNLIGKMAERKSSDLAAVELLEMVAGSVKGSPGYGQNSALYRALGFVRKIDRKSGLTRKSKTPTNEIPGDVNVE